MAYSLLCGAVLATTTAAELKRPHILVVLQDDFGWFDFHGPPLMPMHPSLTALASEGITLTNHLVHYHCSPTRRSFLSGRLPIHHGEVRQPMGWQLAQLPIESTLGTEFTSPHSADQPAQPRTTHAIN